MVLSLTDITDSLNQRSGNPYLKPELIHSFELTYNQNLKKGSISWVAFYRLRNDAILPYTVLDENGVAFTQPQNFGKATTLGAEIIASCNPVSFYGFNASVSAFNISIEDVESSSGIANSTFTWYMKLINNFKVVRNGSAQLTWSYTAPTAIPQGESVAVYFVDAGYQHSILNGKGRLGLVITDIFNTQKNGVTIDDADFTFSRIFKQHKAVMATFAIHSEPPSEKVNEPL
ncbi:MAG: outer membrane beta-barrel family protein [Cyclobacteriaceae bacterium]|nr:outer membrane beta-barrel family protein [Cyclobacteriaceae bacterium]